MWLGFLSTILTPFGLVKEAKASCSDQQCKFESGIYSCEFQYDGGQTCSVSGNDMSCTEYKCPPPPGLRAKADWPLNLTPALTLHPDPQLAAFWERCGAPSSSVPRISTAEAPVPSRVHGETVMDLLAHRADTPLSLVLGTFGNEDLLVGGKVLNATNRTATAYQIAWVYQFNDGKFEFVHGPWMDVPEGIKPGAVINIPPQNASAEPLKRGVRAVSFYVAAVKFAGGSKWSLTNGDVAHILKTSATSTTTPSGSSPEVGDI